MSNEDIARKIVDGCTIDVEWNILGLWKYKPLVNVYAEFKESFVEILVKALNEKDKEIERLKESSGFWGRYCARQTDRIKQLEDALEGLFLETSSLRRFEGKDLKPELDKLCDKFIAKKALNK